MKRLLHVARNKLRQVLLPFFLVFAMLAGNNVALSSPALEVAVEKETAKVNWFEVNVAPEWISNDLALAATSDVRLETAFVPHGMLYIWSLRTGRLAHSLEFPARIRWVFGVDNDSALLVLGGPENKDITEPYLYKVDPVTGKVVVKYIPSQNGAGYQTKAWLSRDRRFLYAGHGQAWVQYDLSKPDVPPQEIPNGDPRATPVGVSIQKSMAPNWMKPVGVFSGRLMLNQDDEGAGVWRTDTMECLLRLGNRSVGIRSWIVSPDGTVVVGIRSGPTGLNLIFDLRNFQASEWEEPNLYSPCTPALTPDGEVIRFARRKDDAIEFVSREWRTGRESVDATIPKSAQTRDHIYGGTYRVSVSAVYSDDAQALAFSGNTEVSTLRWPEKALAPPSDATVSIDTPELAGISPDGGRIWYLNDHKGKWDELFQTSVWEQNRNASTPVGGQIKTMGHSPSLRIASYPGFPNEILCYTVAGLSAGPYGFGATIFPANSTVSARVMAESEMDRLRGASVVNVSHGPISKYVLAVWYDWGARTFDLNSGARLDEFKDENARREVSQMEGVAGPGVLERLCAPIGGRLFVPLLNGGLQVLGVSEDGKFVRQAQIWSPEPHSWIISRPDGFYSSSPRHSPVFFKISGRLYPIEEFDAEYNRPDAVAEALGSKPEVIANLKRDRERRLARLGLNAKPAADAGNDRPGISVLTVLPLIHDHDYLPIKCQVHKVREALAAIDVFVNDVPVFGAQGMPIPPGSADDAVVPVSVPLSFGRNKLQFAVRDSWGVSSYRETFYVHRTEKKAAPKRYIAAVGISNYEEVDLKLNYAAKDAADVAAALATAAGSNRVCVPRVLTDGNATKARILALTDFFKQAAPGDEAILFLSGHGDVDENGEYFFCPSNFHREDLANRLSFSDLESIWNGVPALSRLVLIDSCHSGALNKDELQDLQVALARGARTRNIKPLFQTADSNPSKTGSLEMVNHRNAELFLDLRRTTGATILSASSGVECALERDSDKNGLFTYAILSGLRENQQQSRGLTAGDLIEGVGKTVAELTGGVQHPEVRFMNLAADFPISLSKHSAANGEPLQILENLARWTGGYTSEFNPRSLTCFADRVSYFRKTFSRDDIAKDMTKYNLEFGQRQDKVEKVLNSSNNADGTVTIDYIYSLNHGALRGSQELDKIMARHDPKYVVGNMRIMAAPGREAKTLVIFRDMRKMRAVFRPVEGEWKIISLSSLGSVPPK